MISVAVALSLIVLGCFWYFWDYNKNHGLTFGYYGEFNTVSNALSEIKEITILESWYNQDTTLEEFGFEIRWADGHTNSLAFGEQAPVRKLSGVKLHEALVAEIQKASAEGWKRPDR